MTFAHPQFLWLATLIPLGLVLGVVSLRHRMRRLARFADESILPEIAPPLMESRRRGYRRTIFLTGVLSLVVAAVLGPRWGFTWREGKRKGVDLVIAVDLSESMLAQDVPPTRLERSRRKISDLLQLLRGDRVGLVTFAGIAFIEIPLTVDYGAFLLFMDNLRPEFAPVQGSNIELALEKSFDALGLKSADGQQAAAESNGRTKAILLMSDGEELDGDVSKAIAKAKRLGVTIYTYGIGTTEGAPIYSDGAYKKDKQGRVIVTRLQEEVLTKLALETGGIYVKSVATDEDLRAIYLQGLKKSLIDSTSKAEKSKQWNEYFQLPLFVAVCLLLLGPWGQLLLRTFARATMVLLLAILPANAWGDSPEHIGSEARQAFESGDFQSALKQFDQGKSAASEDFRFSLGVGASHYRLNDYEAAKGGFLDAAGRAQNPTDKAAALYNAGNSQVQLKDYQGAIKTYESALSLNPSDKEAKDNLEYARRLLEQQQQQDKQDQQNKDQQQKQEKDKNSQSGGSGEQQEQEKQQEQDKNKQEEQQQQQEKEEEKEKDQQQSSEGQSQEEQQSEKSSADQQGKPDSQKEDRSQDPSKQSEGTQGKEPDEQESKQDPSPEPTQNPAEDGQGESPESLADNEKGEQKHNEPSQAGSMESLFDGIQEKSDARLKFRGEKASRELKSLQRKPPLRDW